MGERASYQKSSKMIAEFMVRYLAIGSARIGALNSYKDFGRVEETCG
jgi:hypothetical protein